MLAKVAGKNRITGLNGNGKAAKAEKTVKRIEIPALQQGVITLRLIGDRPLLVNNKFAVADELATDYGGPGGKTAAVKREVKSPDEMYRGAFYTLPDSKYQAPDPRGRYGVPAGGLKKCIDKATRSTGITDLATIGLISRSFSIVADSGGLCLIRGKFEKDIRNASVRGMPSRRYRPIWAKWELHVKVIYNAKILSPEQLVNLFMHGGQYVGLCEMRAEKRQGECGGFIVKSM